MRLWILKSELVSAGFDEHASYVIPAVEKVIQRAIMDFDDIIIEGVHLVPGLIDIDQFGSDASIYFFVLSSDEESHKERFVKRAVQIHRGGKQLEFFSENRIIHDHLLSQADANNIKIIDTDSIEKSIAQILAHINKSTTTIKLINTVNQLEDVVNIIINKNNGNLEQVSYPIAGFKDPLIRKVTATNAEAVNRFIKTINNKKDNKADLNKLYNLSKYREMIVSGPL